ncbi:DNA-directed RNA polymerase III subunit RPC7 isoform X2 [Nycticebus coucang]|uniref:DNA-directed RNA polymerase III subunit RPC7 isoform X2 n=1 Tax=Nycticebus coucang TaxID=9470 RepID=UPI00234C5014|nr:DNA-directed RNA polymerase III subunit RPC7 isoform X2 [Nycticebus coucang]
MAGNKGRGRAAFTFNVEAVGFTRGEKLPDVVLKPPPLFPDTDYKPVPLKTGESEDYVLALKQELRETMKRMPYFFETPEENQDIERYSKRYMKVYKEEWTPAGPNSKQAKDRGRGTSLINPSDVLKKIEELEKRGDGEKSDEENEEKEGSKDKSKEGDDDDDEDGAAEQEDYDEEEQEEENDYINSYFEDGDDFGADSDDNMDEATY